MALNKNFVEAFLGSEHPIPNIQEAEEVIHLQPPFLILIRK